MNIATKSKYMVGSLRWMRSDSPKEKTLEELMDGITKRGKKPNSPYYADIWHCGVRVRRNLKTAQMGEAIKRLGEILTLIEKGEYQRGNIKFEKLLSDYVPGTPRKESIIRIHLLPAFKGQRVGEMDIPEFIEQKCKEQSQSSMGQIYGVMRELGLEFEGKSSELVSKKFGIDQILDHDQVLNVIRSYVPKRYRQLCLVAIYSMLRMNDILGLRKKDVDLGRDGGITIVPSKTRETNPDTLFFPMSRKLAGAFHGIGVQPFGPDDLWFPGINPVNVSQGIKRAFVQAGILWGSFKQFRHFGACYLAENGVPVEEIQRLMHHKKLSTTQIYARVTKGKLRESVAVFDNPQSQNQHKWGAR